MTALSSLLAPFWRGPRMIREPLLFIGSPRSSCRAQVLHSKISDATLRAPASEFAYAVNDDYIVEEDGGCIVRTPHSRMPLLSSDEIATADPSLLHSRLVTIDYTHASPAWFDEAALDKSHLLPETSARWRAGVPLRICVVGDSISAGYDATAFRGVPPFQPSYVELVERALETTGRSPVSLHNHAVAGWTTEHAQWEIPEVAQRQPSLVFFALGMNDATYAEPRHFVERIADMVRQLSDHSQDTEFLLLTPMLPTSACEWVNLDWIEGYRNGLLALEQPGIAVADVTRMWRELLGRKHPLELSGNGTNHPNDFGHRVYAQTVLAALGQLPPFLE